jgi:hypothetical protein
VDYGRIGRVRHLPPLGYFNKSKFKSRKKYNKYQK